MIKFSKIFKKVVGVVLAAALAFTCFNFAPTTAESVTSAGNIAKGIDVSKYQGTINWSQVAASGIKFAFVKVGSTYSGMDPTFPYNMTQAQANGIKTGAYIYSYATNTEMAALEAQLVIQWLSAYQVSMPVVFDIEDACHKNLSAAEINSIINTFCVLVDAAGYYPVVYSYKNFFNSKIGASPWDKWVAQFGDSLDYGSCAFWQHSSKGSVPGIAGKVDLNYQYKDYSKLIVKDGFVDHNGSKRFYSNYKMQIGWVNYQNARYFFDPFGYIVKGWHVEGDGKMYYLSQDDGRALIGPNVVDGYTFYFNNDGAVEYGFIDYGKGNRYFDPLANGAMATTWFGYNGQMYYADKDGNIAVGYREIDKVPYFFEENGALAINKQVESNGKQFMSGLDGVLTEIVPIAEGDVPSGKLDAQTMAAMNGIDLSTLNEAQLKAFMDAVDAYNAMIP